VTFSIEFDYQPFLGAVVVDDIRFDRVLAAKLEAVQLTTTKHSPE
jgi:hypothetical protein